MEARLCRRLCRFQLRRGEARLRTLHDACQALTLACIACQSVRRCLTDYAGSESVFSLAGFWWQAPPLLFRGTHRLTVTRAPDPSQVIWEHLELSTWSRLLRQTGVNVVLLLLLSVSLLFIILAQAQQGRFQAHVPTYATCNTVLPAIAFQQPIYKDGSLAPGSKIPPGVSLQWDQNDQLCPLNSQRIYWSPYGAGPYTIRRSTNPCLDECVSTVSPVTCAWPTYDNSTYTFSTGQTIACFCAAALGNAIVSKGVFTGATAVYNSEGSLCTDVASSYITYNAVSHMMLFPVCGCKAQFSSHTCDYVLHCCSYRTLTVRPCYKSHCHDHQLFAASYSRVHHGL